MDGKHVLSIWKEKVAHTKEHRDDFLEKVFYVISAQQHLSFDLTIKTAALPGKMEDICRFKMGT